MVFSKREHGLSKEGTWSLVRGNMVFSKEGTWSLVRREHGL